MNDCVRNWNMDDDFRPFHSLHPTGNQRKTIRSENELVELLWQNGHVVMNSQNNRDQTAATINENRETQRQENTNNPIQQDEQVSWMNYPLDDPLTKDFYSDFFYGMPTSDSLAIDKMGKFGLTEEANVVSNLIPPSTSQTFCSNIPQNFAHFSKPGNVDPQIGSQRELGESSSMVSKLSGNWGSNQVQKWTDFGGKHEEDVRGKLGQSETHDTTTITSSSGGSGPDVGRTGEKITRSQNQKRKGREDEESESYSEEAEYQSQSQSQSQSLELGRRPQRSASARRSRAAEVHNLSERGPRETYSDRQDSNSDHKRRRDRINEKMKALQELIPHCNKTDKASMLDEAIEYLKSLQLQVQIMWMGGGMTPMVFPIAQKYLSLMGSVTDQGSIPAIPGHAQIPRAPMPNQPLPLAAVINQAVAGPPVLNPLNFSNQTRGPIDVHDAYAHYFGLQNMQLPPSQQSHPAQFQSQPAQPIQRTTLIGTIKPPNVSSSSNDNTG